MMTKDFVPSGALRQENCGLKLRDRPTWYCGDGSQKAKSAGMAWPTVKLVLVKIMAPPNCVVPAQAGTQVFPPARRYPNLDSRLRGNDRSNRAERRSVLDVQQLHIEHQHGIRRNHRARATLAVTQRRRNDQRAFAADFHAGH